MNETHSLCESLPFWEFESKPIPHVILWDGSISAGIELLPLDIECFDESRINQLTLGLRAFANSLPEGTTSQFMVKIESDVEKVIQKHTALVTTPNEFLKRLDQKRAENLVEQVEAGLLFRPRLLYFLKTEGAERPGVLSFTQTKKFAADFEKGFEDRLQTLSQALENAKSTLASLGFVAQDCSKEDLVQIQYEHLNPNRAEVATAPTICNRMTDIDDPSPREQLVFGDLVLDQEDFNLDGLKTRVITLKTLPEMTYAGMMSGFLALPFKYELLFFNEDSRSSQRNKNFRAEAAYGAFALKFIE